ncbi:MAG: hypothetical protein ACP5LF_02030 [Nitrososphaeria archaeon]|nr:hypothetical protein [Conexivisphaerales archaeon]
MEYYESNIKPVPNLYGFWLLKVILDDRQAPAMTAFLPKYRIPSEYIALCKLSINFDQAVNTVVMIESSRIINDVAYHERPLLRNKRKRPYGRHTRGLLWVLRPYKDTSQHDPLRI